MSEDTFSLAEEQPQNTPPFLEESFPQVDPNAVEKELIGQFQEMQKDMPAHDVAAHFFQMYYPVYRQLLSGLSNKDARRVAEHVVQWPLEDENPKFNDEKAKQAFSVGIRLVDCKMIMKTFVEMERHQEILEQQAKAAEARATTEQVVQPSEKVPPPFDENGEQQPSTEETQGEEDGQ